MIPGFYISPKEKSETGMRLKATRPIFEVMQFITYGT
jgi:hypothetical protein